MLFRSIFVTAISTAREAMYYGGQLGMNDGTYAFIMLELNIDSAVRKLAHQSDWFRGDYIETTTLSEASKELYHSVLLMNVNPNRGKGYDQFVYDLKVAMSKAPFYSQEYVGYTVRRNRTYYNFNKKVRNLWNSGFSYITTRAIYRYIDTYSHSRVADTPVLRTCRY